MNRQPHSSIGSTIHPARVRAVGATATLALVVLLAQGCASQSTFDSANRAVDSLVAAVRAQDVEQVRQVLGPQCDEIRSSGDKVADASLRDNFLKAYDEKHQLVASTDGSMTLVVGKSDWPMPIPIVQEGGRWRFDTAAGIEEILNRRIGHNELCAIQTCLAILDAQREYVSADRDANGLCEYASRFFSEPGKKNGLFWQTAQGEPPSPLGPLVAEAAEEGYRASQPSSGSARPYHGYLFRILTGQGPGAPGGALDYMVRGKLIGGFGIIAWPAQYGNSGIMTFVMNHEGIVYQRDLGEGTAKTASAIAAYDPGPEWTKVSLNK